MSTKFNYITVQLLPDDKSDFDINLLSKSTYLKAAIFLNSARIVGPLAEEIKKDASLGHIWHDVAPDSGKYTFELATELSYFLPNYDKKPEYILKRL